MTNPIDRSRRALLESAREILDANWAGTSTVPAAGLYPHQWSWDSAFIAIGRSWYDQERAQVELESLLAGQWADGRIPHIVFNPRVARNAYFPGPAFWRSDEVPDAPADVQTSGLIQPPLHACAALEVYRHASDPAEATGFLARVFPALRRWHDYLTTARDQSGIGLAGIVHPWESGLDNSPAWEETLGALEIPPGSLPAYQRRDLAHADPDDRPTDAAYDRFVFLAQEYRDAGYDDRRIFAGNPFLIVGPLVNAILVWSSLAMVEIAGILGEDAEPHRRTADRVRGAIQRELWHEGDGRYYTRNLRRAEMMREPSVLSFMPIVDPQLPADGLRGIIRDLSAPCFHPPEGMEHYVVPSYDLTGGHFDPRRYWRGPVWINTDWLIWRGLRRHGQMQLAAHVADSMLALVRRSGFREYFHPFSGEGYGADRFSWTAALIIDLLERQRIERRS